LVMFWKNSFHFYEVSTSFPEKKNTLLLAKFIFAPSDVVRCIIGYKACLYSEPLIPRVRGGEMQKRHTVMIIRPRIEWAKLYLDWMKELRMRQQTVIGTNKNRLDF
jgi:hypothetical protein